MNPSNIIHFSQHISDAQIAIIRTINQLTSKYEKMYLVHQTNEIQNVNNLSNNQSDDQSGDQSDDQSDDQSNGQSNDLSNDLSENVPNNISDDELFNWENLSDIVIYQKSTSVVIKHFKYLNFVRIMRSCDYQYDDITSDIRVWCHSSLTKFKDESGIIKFIFLSNAQIQRIRDYKIELSKSCVYIEIKGFTDYGALFDMMTMDCFNEYPNLRKVTRNMNKLFNQFVTADIHIYASDVTTMIIPFIVNYYQEMIHTIHVKDPIFYPYGFQTFYINLRKDNELRMNVGCQYNLIGLLNNLSLVDVYIDPEMCDKNENMMYSHNTVITFSDKFYKYVDKDNLIMMMELYSNVLIE